MCDAVMSPTLCSPQDYPVINMYNSVKSFLFFGALIHQIVVLTTAHINNKLPKYIVVQVVACCLAALGPMLFQSENVSSAPIIKSTKFIYTLLPCTLAIFSAWYRAFCPVTWRSKALAQMLFGLNMISFLIISVPSLWVINYIRIWYILTSTFLTLFVIIYIYTLFSYSHARRWLFSIIGVFLNVSIICICFLVNLRSDLISGPIQFVCLLSLTDLVTLYIVSYVAQRRRNNDNETDNLIT